MKNLKTRAAAVNISKLLLSAIACFLSVRLLMGVESEPGIAYDTGDAEHLPTAAIGEITNGKLAADEHIMPKIEEEMAAGFARALAVNEETAGWLLIPNVCYYPVMYSKTHNYYLTHDPQRAASVRGSIFINSQCEPDFDGMLTLIHGHNMKDATMFGRLGEYLGEDFFRNNSPIMICDGELIRKYKPFTVVILAENNDVTDAHGLSDAERISYLESMYDRSVCKMEEGEKPDLTKPIIFFSTCDYSFSEARLLVGAYLTDTRKVGG